LCAAKNQEKGQSKKLPHGRGKASWFRQEIKLSRQRVEVLAQPTLSDFVGTWGGKKVDHTEERRYTATLGVVRGTLRNQRR